jgi:hypothetical protein
MADCDAFDPDSDPFRPPSVSTLVACLHCGQEYDSFRIEWRIERCSDGKEHGFWYCPIEGCDGRGFGFDILPVDPDYQDEHGGWVHDDEGTSGDFDEDKWPFSELEGPESASVDGEEEPPPW